jgi:Iap family predicted aminopeptidase
MIKPSTVADKHQHKIAVDTVKNPNKALLGGLSVEDAKKILKNKFKYTDQEIQELEKGRSLESRLRTKIRKLVEDVLNEGKTEIYPEDMKHVLKVVNALSLAEDASHRPLSYNEGFSKFYNEIRELRLKIMSYAKENNDMYDFYVAGTGFKLVKKGR